MQSIARSLALFAAVFGSLSACTARVEPGGDGEEVHPRVAGATAEPSVNSNDTVSTKSQVAVAALSWSGSVGSWCGPVEEQTLWLNARPQAAACDNASHQLYTTGEAD